MFNLDQKVHLLLLFRVMYIRLVTVFENLLILVFLLQQYVEAKELINIMLNYIDIQSSFISKPHYVLILLNWTTYSFCWVLWKINMFNDNIHNHIHKYFIWNYYYTKIRRHFVTVINEFAYFKIHGYFSWSMLCQWKENIMFYTYFVNRKGGIYTSRL